MAGFDIYKKYSNQTIDLKKIIEELEVDYGLCYDKQLSFSFDKIKRLPKTINKWYAILDNIAK
jgi:hypothetical protein